MGHVESGGEAGAVAEEPRVWALWRALRKHFPVWSLFPSALWTPGAYGYAGVDFVSGFRRNRSTKAVFALLEGVSDRDFDTLTALAALNARRQQQMFHAVAVAYVTIPITLIATSAEIAPEWVERALTFNIRSTLMVLTAFTFSALMYFASHWRARQILGVLDLVRIERGAQPYTAMELREE